MARPRSSAFGADAYPPSEIGLVMEAVEGHLDVAVGIGWQTVARPRVPMRRRAVDLEGALVDRLTQRWVIATGRRVDFEGAHRWLDGPVGAPDGVGEAWIDQHVSRTGARLEEGDAQGLLPDLSELSGEDFDAGAVSSPIVGFYENTAEWSVDVWSRWSRWAEPGGRLINALFAHRLRQLSLPIDPLDVAYGMRSRVVGVVGSDGSHLGTVWQRTVRSTGATVFAGFYGIATRPSAGRPSIRVVFPLPNGSLTVFLRPDVTTDGGLVLTSPGGDFGDDGAYLVVRPGASPQGWARRVSLPERFELSSDVDGVVRCDHRLGLGRYEVLRLHYRLQRVPVR